MIVYDSFSPSLYHKIQFSNGTDKCFMCMYVYTCIHAYIHAQKNINFIYCGADKTDKIVLYLVSLV